MNLDDTLWAYCIVYKTPIGTTTFWLVYGKSCHHPIELEHKANWAIQTLNFDLKAASKKRLLQLNELDEIRQDAYENAMIFKDKIKRWHERCIARKEIKEGDLVLLFNSRLKLFPGKLKSRWSRPFKFVQVFPQGAVEIWSETSSAFKVNGQRLKPYFQGEPIEKEANYTFDNPPDRL
ncbi:uncharacterized protein LOC131177921 [Hevea brasiliensis]|uniref:uncharacterized protein LOC131177921 n=1 Tax=Hevea brasiliensis TaxID=3981 RepID=UPI0025D17083|nr:uncharacterized protein LOC131177921 [Hevea brasiliensis]